MLASVADTELHLKTRRIASRSELWCRVPMNGLRVRWARAAVTSGRVTGTIPTMARGGEDETRVIVGLWTARLLRDFQQATEPSETAGSNGGTR